ncbi:DUF2442 domain-containing protein [Candidatus Thiosymbion oneisti]|uniref:DUF2442 domain-containing protein n=1 Tax=Candidatus Thiosymbion oneisti TaxID=589554 RepID=UPI00105E8ECC
MNASLKGKKVRFDDQYLHVELVDGRIISTPIRWYKELQNATFNQITNYTFICANTGIEWPDIDYHLNIESMLIATSQAKAA